MPQLVLFWILAPISIVAAFGMVLARNAVHSALFLIVTFFSLAVAFLALGSPFLFVVQIIVYAGAIMVLFLFVIMLLGVDREESMRERIAGQRWMALLLGLGLLAEVTAAVRLGIGIRTRAAGDFNILVNHGDNVRALAGVLFNGYFLPFEVTSVLLIVAAVGVILHARRRHGDGGPLDRADAPPGEPLPLEEPGGSTPVDPESAGVPGGAGPVGATR